MPSLYGLKDDYGFETPNVYGFAASGSEELYSIADSNDGDEPLYGVPAYHRTGTLTRTPSVYGFEDEEASVYHNGTSDQNTEAIYGIGSVDDATERSVYHNHGSVRNTESIYGINTGVNYIETSKYQNDPSTADSEALYGMLAADIEGEYEINLDINTASSEDAPELATPREFCSLVGGIPYEY